MDWQPGSKKDNSPQVEEGLSRRTWEARKSLPFPKEFFALQLAFAKELAKKNGQPLLSVIASCAPTLRRNMNSVVEDLLQKKDETSDEQILELVYGIYLELEEEDKLEPVLYHKEGGVRFGCFYYDIDGTEEENIVRLHFFNAESGATGPLDKSKVENRKSEIHDMLLDIKRRYPNIKMIRGTSWLFNIPAFNRLFPESFLEKLEKDEHKILWSLGTTIWGQFLDNQMKLKPELAEELLKRVRNLPASAHLSDLFEGDSKIMPPLAARGPIQDFYEMYGIK